MVLWNQRGVKKKRQLYLPNTIFSLSYILDSAGFEYFMYEWHLEGLLTFSSISIWICNISKMLGTGNNLYIFYKENLSAYRLWAANAFLSGMVVSMYTAANIWSTHYTVHIWIDCGKLFSCLWLKYWTKKFASISQLNFLSQAESRNKEGRKKFKKISIRSFL